MKTNTSTTTYNTITILIYMIIDEVREVEMEEHIEDDNDEEEEDLSNIPLFESCDEIEETSSIFQSSVTFLESDSAPQAATSLLLDSDMRQEDLQEEDIRDYFQNGCGCLEECHKKFSESYVRTLRSDMLQMTRSEYDLVIMAQLKATTSMGGLTSGNRKRSHDRERDTFFYQHEGVKVMLLS